MNTFITLDGHLVNILALNAVCPILRNGDVIGSRLILANSAAVTINLKPEEVAVAIGVHYEVKDKPVGIKGGAVQMNPGVDPRLLASMATVQMKRGDR